MTRARDLSRLSNSNAFSVDSLNRIGIGSTTPRADLDVIGNVLIGDDISIQSGIVTATTFSGNITGVAATFTGNVSIAGTLTYEDVTNIDSVGLITARSGVVLTGGDITLGTGVTASGTTANTFTLSTGGSGRVTVDSSGNINVDSGGVYYDAVNNRLAVGTTSPIVPFHVSTSATNTPGLLEHTASVDSYLYIKNSTGGAYIASRTNDLSFHTSAGATERLRITSDGKLGLGTSSPGCLLELSKAGANGAQIDLKTSDSTTATSRIRGVGSDGFSDGEIRFADNGINFQTGPGGASQRVRIDSSGNVGVGTTNPVNALVVSNNGAFGFELDVTSGYLQTYNRSTSAYADLVTRSNTIQFRTGAAPVERARIDSSGRLLVGTSTSPSAGSWSQYSRLVVKGNTTGAANSAAVLNLGSGVAATSLGTDDGLGVIAFSDLNGNEFATIVAATDGTVSSTSDLPGKLVFSTTADGASSPTPRMTITKDGDVLIGKTTSEGLITISGSSCSGYIGAIENRNLDNCDPAHGLILRAGKNGGSTISQLLSFRRPDDAVLGSITQNGVSSVAYNTSSDYRLKENVTPVTDAITRLQQLKPSRFNFIADPDKTVDGFLAHEVQDIVPEAITGEKDAVDDEGNPKYQGIDQSKLVPLLTAALQEAVAKIESLEARLTAAGI